MLHYSARSSSSNPKHAAPLTMILHATLNYRKTHSCGGFPSQRTLVVLFPEIVRGGVLVEPSIRCLHPEKRRSRDQSRSRGEGYRSLDLDEEKRSRHPRAHRFELRATPLRPPSQYLLGHRPPCLWKLCRPARIGYCPSFLNVAYSVSFSRHVLPMYE